jgi:hypothetical protein
MTDTSKKCARSGNSVRHLARVMLFVFLLTFICARVVVFLIMARRIPDFFLYLGGTHVHHLNYGIFLLSAVGGYLILVRPMGFGLEISAIVYAIGLALTFDEFGIWLHLGGSYWQRASFDAVTVVAALLGLISIAPNLRSLRLRQWWWIAMVVLLVSLFFVMFVDSFKYAERIWTPKFKYIEEEGPR